MRAIITGVIMTTVKLNIWFFYPETSGRSLEEIDLIFAKGYVEKISYVRASMERTSKFPSQCGQS
jgi:hypothetical protein